MGVEDWRRICCRAGLAVTSLFADAKPTLGPSASQKQRSSMSRFNGVRAYGRGCGVKMFSPVEEVGAEDRLDDLLRRGRAGARRISSLCFECTAIR